MENGIYLGLSRQMALDTKMSIIANNVANINTPGFRGQNALFEEYVSDPRGASDPLSFVIDSGQFQSTNAGTISYTGNQFDVALEGPGYFGVEGPGGEPAYSRAGNFTQNSDGELINSSGRLVLDEGGGAIEIPEDSTEITVDNQGRISNQNGEFAELMVAEFENVQELEPIGESMYITDADPIDNENTTVKQAHLEGSNVNGVVEITRMIDVLRSHQSSQRNLQGEHDRLRSAIQELTDSN